MEVDRVELITGVASEIFEKYAFMFIEETPLSELAQDIQRCISVSMSFKGEKQGSLKMFVPDEMCARIATNVLGIHPEDERSRSFGEDSLKELLNVICGNLLIELAGEEPLFQLTIPESRKCNVADWKAALQGPDALGFVVDDNPVIMEFTIEE